MIKIALTQVILLLGIQLLGQSPEDPAKTKYSEGSYEEALLLAQQCIGEDSTYIPCLSILANAARNLGDQAQAKKYYHEIEKIDTNNVDAYIHLASIYEQQQHIPKAIKYYSILNEKLPDNAIYFRKNAKLFRQVNDLPMAFRLYAEAYRINSRDILALRGLAELCVANDQMSMADSLVQMGLEIDAENISLYLLLARSKYKQKQYDSVTFVLEDVQRHVDLDSYFNKLLGYSYLQIDSVDQAIQKLSMALVSDKQPEKLHYYLASAFEKKEEYEGALEHYTKAVQFGISPDLDLYHRNTARMAYQNKNMKKAIEHYKDAYKYGKDPLILYHLATISDQYYKDKSIAINYYKRYLKSAHSHAEFREYAQKRSRYLKEQEHLSN